MKLNDVDKLKFPNIAIFDMKLHGTVRRIKKESEVER